MRDRPRRRWFDLEDGYGFLRPRIVLLLSTIVVVVYLFVSLAR